MWHDLTFLCSQNSLHFSRLQGTSEMIPTGDQQSMVPLAAVQLGLFYSPFASLYQYKGAVCVARICLNKTQQKIYAVLLYIIMAMSTWMAANLPSDWFISAWLEERQFELSTEWNKNTYLPPRGTVKLSSLMLWSAMSSFDGRCCIVYKYKLFYLFIIFHGTMWLSLFNSCEMFPRKRITYCLPTYSVRDSVPPLPFSSAEGERKHMLLLHCPLSSEYVQGAVLSFSFLVDTAIERQNTIISDVIINTVAACNSSVHTLFL